MDRRLRRQNYKCFSGQIDFFEVAYHSSRQILVNLGITNLVAKVGKTAILQAFQTHIQLKFLEENLGQCFDISVQFHSCNVFKQEVISKTHFEIEI